MWMIRNVKIRRHERGLLFRDGTFERILHPGRHWVIGFRLRIRKVSVRDVWLVDPDLEVIARSGALGAEALVLDLKDHERALVSIDGRLDSVRDPGLWVLWTVFHAVRAEVIDTRSLRFEHPDLPLVLAARCARELLEVATVVNGFVGLLYQDGRLVATLPPGVHAFWKDEGVARVIQVDLREQVADIGGQEIMTADRVTLRVNALVTYRVADPARAVSEVDDHRQALYRQAQLALRAVIGTRELDALLADKDGVANELAAMARPAAEAFGVEVKAVGIRDLILPGEMREILNRVTEARKAAEAALITRREETASIRMQANTARVFETSPTLMRLRELEVLEKVAEKANLSVVVGDGGLADRVVKLL